MKKTITIILVILAIVLAFIASQKLFDRGKPKPPAQNQPQYAKPGEVVSGFPTGLILDEKAKVAQSYTINYQAGTKQYTASFQSETALQKLFTNYKTYFKDNGWIITNETTTYPTSRGVYARKDKAEVSVAIIDRKQNREIIISYAIK